MYKAECTPASNGHGAVFSQRSLKGRQTRARNVVVERASLPCRRLAAVAHPPGLQRAAEGVAAMQHVLSLYDTQRSPESGSDVRAVRTQYVDTEVQEALPS